jgi:hypothetical protein
MPTYAINSSKQPMTATGLVEAILEWEETADGRRRPSEKQARHEHTGMPFWGVEVLYVQTAFGRKHSVTSRVVVESAEEPKPAPLTSVTFEGLQVEVRTNKAGQLIEAWTADRLVDSAKPAQRPGSDKAA